MGLQVVSELELDPDCAKLQEFNANNSERIDSAASELAEAMASFQQVMAYFAEDTLTEPSAFFGVFVRLGKSYSQAEKENAVRAERVEKSAASAQSAQAQDRARTQTKPGVRSFGLLLSACLRLPHFVRH